MCEDCAASRPSDDRAVAVLSWMKRSEDGEKDLRCSCCDVILESGFYSPYLVLKPSSWGGLEYAQKGKLDEERSDDADVDHDNDNLVDEIGEQEKGESFVVENCDACDESLELLTPMRVENGLLVEEEERLVPVELIDSLTLIKSNMNSVENPRGGDDEEEEDRDYVGYNLVEDEDTALDIRTVSEEEEEKVALLSAAEINKPQNLPVVDVVEEECSSADHQRGTTQLISILEQELDVRVERVYAEGFGEFQGNLLFNICEMLVFVFFCSLV